MWIRSENDSINKPLKEERAGTCTIIRKNYHLIGADAERPAHWEYDEWQMTAEQYEVYQDVAEKLAEQDDALIELAGLLTEVMS